MEERAQRIVDVAIELAEKGGFQNVRLRDVAEKSGVAFGTLYARFNSKEDILIAALEQETGKFRELIKDSTVPGDTAAERVENFFTVMSRTLFSRPGFAKAVLRSVASGVPGVADKVISYQTMMMELIISAILGKNVEELPPLDEFDEDTVFAGRIMQNIWFAELISWMSEVATDDEVIERTVRSCKLVVKATGVAHQNLAS